VTSLARFNFTVQLSHKEMLARYGCLLTPSDWAKAINTVVDSVPWIAASEPRCRDMLTDPNEISQYPKDMSLMTLALLECCSGLLRDLGDETKHICELGRSMRSAVGRPSVPGMSRDGTAKVCCTTYPTDPPLTPSHTLSHPSRTPLTPHSRQPRLRAGSAFTLDIRSKKAALAELNSSLVHARQAISDNMASTAAEDMCMYTGKDKRGKVKIVADGVANVVVETENMLKR